MTSYYSVAPENYEPLTTSRVVFEDLPDGFPELVSERKRRRDWCFCDILLDSAFELNSWNCIFGLLSFQKFDSY